MPAAFPTSWLATLPPVAVSRGAPTQTSEMKPTQLFITAAILVVSLKPAHTLASDASEKIVAGWQTSVVPAVQQNASPSGQGVGGGGIATGSLRSRKHKLEGIASYYKHGARTASGEKFDKRAMTAAHPTLPFNSLVRVTDRNSGNSVVVRINDRGPFVSGRVIDLSEAAAEAIGMTGRGLTAVRLEVLSGPEGARAQNQ